MSLLAAAAAILATPDPSEKIRLSFATAQNWREGGMEVGAAIQIPDRPARPEKPELRLPRDMPRRRIGGAAGRLALLHAVAHIELNAIDLAWDLIARFGQTLPRAGLDDWVRVAAEEAGHFSLLAARMGQLGGAYGDLPAHDGLWQAAMETRHDVLARLAVVPLVLEARGLDVTPAMIEGFERRGDEESATILRVILRDEITHVATGMRWFRHFCVEQECDAAATWQELVRQHFKGALKPPFNHSARQAAGFPESYYEPVAQLTAP